jgi:hypothetical protein
LIIGDEGTVCNPRKSAGFAGIAMQHVPAVKRPPEGGRNADVYWLFEVAWVPEHLSNFLSRAKCRKSQAI